MLKTPTTGKFRFHLVATNGQVIATSFATVIRAALPPVAYSVGTDFKPAVRDLPGPLDTMVHWDRWEADWRQPRPTCPAL